jgi:predicted signal transduction protein with EAL and GGDEF domain
MFLDLDGFKPVNDTFGHPKGDAVLKSVSQRLVREVAAMGDVGRIGGDEFAIVVRDAQSRRRRRRARPPHHRRDRRALFIDKAEIRIGVSIGCAFGRSTARASTISSRRPIWPLPGQGPGPRHLLLLQFRHGQRAGRPAADRAGHAGRHRIQPVQTALSAPDQRRDQSLLGFEALIRWQHPTRGMVSPIEFIPIAEETGLILDLGNWVIEEACRAAAVWPANITVAVNVSAKQLVFPALPNTVGEALARHRLQANRIELEVTESIFLGENAHTLDVLKRLRALGVGIALDDFGTGYSSLGYLNKASSTN